MSARALLQSVEHLGRGGDGPWENRTSTAIEMRDEGVISYPVVAAWLNAEYSVQLLRHETHPGIDHLLIRRHDEGTDFPWPVLQAIKDRLAPDGQLRWAHEAFPPRLAVVDNRNLRHLFVMPIGWEQPIDLNDVRT